MCGSIQARNIDRESKQKHTKTFQFPCNNNNILYRSTRCRNAHRPYKNNQLTLRNFSCKKGCGITDLLTLTQWYIFNNDTVYWLAMSKLNSITEKMVTKKIAVSDILVQILCLL